MRVFSNAQTLVSECRMLVGYAPREPPPAVNSEGDTYCHADPDYRSGASLWRRRWLLLRPWCRVGHPTLRRRTARSCANYFVDPLAHWQHGRWPDDALNVRPRPISNWRHHTPSSSAPRPRPSGSARVVLQIFLIIVGVAFGLWALHRVSVLRPASSYSQRRSSTIAAGWILYWNRRRLVRRRFRRLVVSTVRVPLRLLSRMLASRSARVRWAVLALKCAARAGRLTLTVGRIIDLRPRTAMHGLHGIIGGRCLTRASVA